MSEWSISFDDELEKYGYRVKWLHSDVYDVYAPNSQWITVCRNPKDARTEAWKHYQNTQQKKRPRIVCLCGSTRFSAAYQKANLLETLAGKIVLTIGCDMRSDIFIFKGLDDDSVAEIKAKLDELHLRKIDLADEILVLNVEGYVGESTRREIEYARQHGKDIRWLEPE